jgi:hypothetical protein
MATRQFDEWVKHVGLLLGFRELDDQTRDMIELLGKQGYTASETVAYLRKQIGVNRLEV